MYLESLALPPHLRILVTSTTIGFSAYQRAIKCTGGTEERTEIQIKPHNTASPDPNQLSAALSKLTDKKAYDPDETEPESCSARTNPMEVSFPIFLFFFLFYRPTFPPHYSSQQGPTRWFVIDEADAMLAPSYGPPVPMTPTSLEAMSVVYLDREDVVQHPQT